jgi:hypothetical protein
MDASWNLIRTRRHVGRGAVSFRLCPLLGLEVLLAIPGEYHRAVIAAQHTVRGWSAGRADLSRRIFVRSTRKALRKHRRLGPT